MIEQAANVPCGSCHQCCRSELVTLMPDKGDLLASYEHEQAHIPGLGNVPVLKHKANGDCVYLGETGCTIHHRAPFICKIFDCRHFFLFHPRSDRKRMERQSPGTKAVFAAGRERLHTLEDNDAGHAIRAHINGAPKRGR